MNDKGCALTIILQCICTSNHHALFFEMITMFVSLNNPAYVHLTWTYRITKALWFFNHDGGSETK